MKSAFAKRAFTVNVGAKETTATITRTPTLAPTHTRVCNWSNKAVKQKVIEAASVCFVLSVLCENKHRLTLRADDEIEFGPSNRRHPRRAFLFILPRTREVNARVKRRTLHQIYGLKRESRALRMQRRKQQFSAAKPSGFKLRMKLGVHAKQQGAQHLPLSAPQLQLKNLALLLSARA